MDDNVTTVWKFAHPQFTGYAEYIRFCHKEHLNLYSLNYYELTKISGTKTVPLGHHLLSVKQYLFGYCFGATFQNGTAFPLLRKQQCPFSKGALRFPKRYPKGTTGHVNKLDPQFFLNYSENINHRPLKPFAMCSFWKMSHR